MSDSKPRHTFDRFLKEEELADRMLKVAGSTQTTSTAKVPKESPTGQAATKYDKGKTESDWEVVETPGDAGEQAAEGSWVDIRSTKSSENKERGTPSVQQTKKT